ncbi:MAG: ABC transporter ATP-binding protein [Longicatena sp.]
MKTTEVMMRLWSFVKESHSFLLLAFIGAVCSVLCSLVAPLSIGALIDALSKQASLSVAIPYLCILLFLYLGYSLFQWCMMYASNKIAFSSSYYLRKKVFHKLDKLPISFFDTHARGDLISHFINDIDFISNGLLQGLSTMIGGIVTIVVCMSIMLVLNWQMSIVVILSAPFTYFVAKTITTRTHSYFRIQANTLGELNGFSEEMIAQIKTIKTYHNEEHIVEQFKQINQTLYANGVNSQFYGSLANPSTRFVSNSAYALVGMIGAIMALQGSISIGSISVFLMYATMFSKPFNEITGVLTQLQSGVASAKRIFTLLDLAEEKNVDSLTSFQHVLGDIRFSNVSFSYDKNKPLIQNLTLHVQAGSKVAIVGKTGAGKTTLVNLLMRFYDIQSGDIYLDDKSIYECTRDSLRQNIGLVLQDTYLFEDSIAANIAYGKKDATREDIIKAAKKSGAHDFIRRLEQGYDTLLHANSNSLSKGQCQLLSITRVLLMDPSILILDEATSSIDTCSEQHINKAMFTLMEGKTSFVIAHRLSTIIHSDIILAMDHGDIVEQGSHEALLAKNGYYAQLYQSQFM